MNLICYFDFKLAIFTSGVPVQTDNAEQTAAGVGRLRG